MPDDGVVTGMATLHQVENQIASIGVNFKHAMVPVPALQYHNKPEEQREDRRCWCDAYCRQRGTPSSSIAINKADRLDKRAFATQPAVFNQYITTSRRVMFSKHLL